MLEFLKSTEIPIWLYLLVAILPVGISIFVFLRQNKIMKQQNNTALFDKRYELYSRIEFILKNITANILIITSLEFIKLFAKSESISKDNQEKEDDKELFLTYMHVLFWGSINTIEKYAAEDTKFKFFHTQKKKELEKYQQNKLVIDKINEYQSCFDKINSLFVLSTKEKGDIRRIKEILTFLEKRVDIFGFNSIFKDDNDESVESNLKELEEIISESSLLKSLKQQLDLHSKISIKDKFKAIIMKKTEQGSEKQSHRAEKNNFITIILPLIVTTAIAGFQIYISITQVNLTGYQLELSEHQNLISSEQSKITETQLDIMNQQNNIALFDKRISAYEMFDRFYLNLEVVLHKEYISILKIFEEHKEKIENNSSFYLFAKVVTPDDFGEFLKVVNDENNILLTNYTLKVSKMMEQLLFLFTLSNLEQNEIARMKGIIWDINKKIELDRTINITPELEELLSIIDDGFFYDTIKSQLYITNSDNLENE